MAARYGISSAVRWTWTELAIEWSLAGVACFQPEDFVVTAEVTYSDLEPHVLRLGAVLIDGPSGTLGRTYGSNDFAYLEYALSW